MLNAILTRLARTRGALSSTFFARSTQTASPKAGKDSLWHSILRRGGQDAGSNGVDTTNGPAGDLLAAARAEFELSVAGLAEETMLALVERIQRSRTLDDLWHLRMGLYNEVARQFSQHEAEQRLARLQVHFTASSRRH